MMLEIKGLFCLIDLAVDNLFSVSVSHRRSTQFLVKPNLPYVTLY